MSKPTLYQAIKDLLERTQCESIQRLEQNPTRVREVGVQMYCKQVLEVLEVTGDKSDQHLLHSTIILTSKLVNSSSSVGLQAIRGVLLSQLELLKDYANDQQLASIYATMDAVKLMTR